MMVVERLYTYRRAVSQKAMLVRDVASTLVNVFLTYAVTAMILLPGLLLLTEYAFGRPLMMASPEQLGPIWLQVPVIWVVVSFFRYWMHRWQHSNEFLWKLHSYHHRVTHLQATNTFVSHPLDYALRNAVVFVLLGVVGFAPLALLIALPALAIPGIFSHCGAELNTGALSRLFVTPEVHRWHHSAVVPEGHRYSVNYSVELSFWDRLFGTYYLPVKDGEAEQPSTSAIPTEPARSAERHRAGVGAFWIVAVRAMARSVRAPAARWLDTRPRRIRDSAVPARAATQSAGC